MPDMAPPKRRRDDNPDWKMAAPRYVLVAGTLGAMAMALTMMKAHVASTDQTVLNVRAMQQKIDEADNRITVQEQATANMCEDIRSMNITQLRWQSYMAKRQGDVVFSTRLREQAEEAERRAANNGCRQHPARSPIP